MKKNIIFSNGLPYNVALLEPEKLKNPLLVFTIVHLIVNIFLNVH